MKRIVPVQSKKELTQFIDFPHSLYEHDKNYVPEIFIGQRDLLTPGKHPFYEHSTAQLFLAFDDQRIVGRIAAIHNRNHNAFTEQNDGFFGFFDCIDDQETADLLLKTAADWLKQKGLSRMVGPTNPTTNDVCGVLVEGFDRPPIAMMPYNAPYYGTLLLNAGLRKKTDLLAYELNVASANERSLKLLDTLQNRLKRSGIVIRKVNLSDFKNEVPKIREVYNKAWDKNLGFVPMTDSEFDYLAKDLKMILDPNFCLVAEKEGQVVGFILGIPDINQILIKNKRGRLFPLGIFRLLTQRKSITRIRVLTLGVLEGYRKLGIEACLYASVIKNTYGTKITGGECSWMLEDNYLMNHAIEQINGVLYKRYRLYEKEV
ncbi:GNAT family N-acetyltransferase [Larkinella harenae]